MGGFAVDVNEAVEDVTTGFEARSGHVGVDATGVGVRGGAVRAA